MWILKLHLLLLSCLPLRVEGTWLICSGQLEEPKRKHSSGTGSNTTNDKLLLCNPLHFTNSLANKLFGVSGPLYGESWDLY